MMTEQQTTDYARVARAIGFLTERVHDQPELADVAKAVGLSAGRTQRLFKRWAGVSPKRFLEFLTVEHAKQLLDRSVSVLETSYETGLSGPGRLHDHFVKLEAVTPGEYKSGGGGLELVWGVHDSPFGPVFLAASERGISRLAFLGEKESAERVRSELESLARSWPGADLGREDASTGELVRRVFDPETNPGEILVRVSGTNFQLAVWKALLSIPSGAVSTYQAVAEAAGNARALRAVGSAVGANPVAYLIPCHRVIRKSGAMGEYRWGSATKHALLAWEAARVS